MRKAKIIWLITGVSLLLAAGAWAAENGGEASSAAAWKDFGWRVLNFVLFAAIIYKLAGKKIKEFFSGRRQQISSELDDLESRKSKAKSKLSEVEKSISDMESKRQEIIDQAKKQGESLRQGIIAKAEEDAEKIKKQARMKAEQERRQTMDALRSEMADEIVDSAEKMIKEKLGKKDQEKLIDNYLTKVVLN
ncbi:MAG: F0F1 ATP synthase subunit B [Desulfohalobiaceae bacterium]|nr:F0F1 ATP synthase subunit B [Desulfohalobiaceae bacterium]